MCLNLRNDFIEVDDFYLHAFQLLCSHVQIFCLVPSDKSDFVRFQSYLLFGKLLLKPFLIPL